jgi:hypothetical protein
MATRSVVYRVLIASPSDLATERKVVTEVIHEWNVQNAAAESVVLLPVKWETHAWPQTGMRPQEAINQQLVGSSDILIGLFWTRLGTSTGVAESGTVEEIDQFVAAGKPAMLYRSNREIDPSKIDIEQFQRLRDFTEATQKKALFGKFSTPDELRHVLLRHLSNCIRSLKNRIGYRPIPIDNVTGIVEIAGDWNKLHDSTAKMLESCDKDGVLYLICINPEAFMPWRLQIETALCKGVKLQLAYVDLEHAASAGKAAEWYAESMCIYGISKAAESTQFNLNALNTSVYKARKLTGVDPDVYIYRSCFPHPFIGVLYQPPPSAPTPTGWGLVSPYLIFVDAAQAHNFGVLFSEPGTIYRRYLESACHYFEFLQKHVTPYTLPR